MSVGVKQADTINFNCHVLGCEDPVAKVQRADQLVAELPGALVLNTCYRLEVYGAESLSLSDAPVVGTYQGVEAMERLARIAAGLESRIVGELEVLGQVRAAYKRFRSRPGWETLHLDGIFQKVLSAARKARRESGIDQLVTSVASLAVSSIANHVQPGEPIAVIGTGSLAGSVARHIVKRGGHPVRIASRCPVRAENLADQLGGAGACLTDLSRLLSGVGGIISATGAPHAVLLPEHVAGCSRPLYIVDLSLPQDCHPDLDSDLSIIRISLQQIEEEAGGNWDERRRRAEIASTIVREDVHQFWESAPVARHGFDLVGILKEA